MDTRSARSRPGARIWVCLLCCLFAGQLAAAQGTGSSTAAKEASKPSPSALEPIFPEENQGLVLVEGEDAVSTNFAAEPVLNYDCSGSRTLQLGRYGNLEGVGSFYADYVFQVPSSGTWELWYGGTPPGPREDIYPSYASPVRITVDAADPISVYAEDVTVTGRYSFSYYWTRVGDLTLDSAPHRIRFDVSEKRRADGRYHFYLDCFFLVKKEEGERRLTAPLPEVFPGDLAAAPLPPFASVDDYLIRIRDNPDDAQAYVDVSLAYAMLGDYLGALKYLNRAVALHPDNQELLRLGAKVRILKGDIADGLKKYRELLAMNPSLRDVWREAGKVAAWTGRYDEAAGFYKDGLAALKGDLELTVNLGLTYLWAGKDTLGEAALSEARAVAGADAAALKRLGRVYLVNGYPDRAAATFDAAVRAVPRDLEAYLLEIQTFEGSGDTAAAAKVEKLITDTFSPSPRLTAYLQGFRTSQGMKREVMQEYERKLAEHPDNLSLRQALAQAYSWNGKKDRAIGEYRRILANQAYLALKDMEVKRPEMLGAMDTGYMLVDFLSRFPAMTRTRTDALGAAVSRYKEALAAQKSAAAASAGADALKDTDKQKTAQKLQAAEALKKAEDALRARTGTLVAEIAAARALAAQANVVVTLAAGSGDALAALKDSEGREQKTFSDLTKAGGWAWDKQLEISDLRADASRDALSRLVLAKILLAERQALAAQTLLAGSSKAGDAGIGLQYAEAQSCLWSGKAAEGTALLRAMASTPSVPSYFPAVAHVAEVLAPPAADPSAFEPQDPVADAEAASRGLAALAKPVAEQRTLVLKNLEALHALYVRAVERAFHSFEEQAAGIRNELGDSYAAQQKLDDAIAQFRRVLAVNPGNQEARFRLGRIYLWGGDWRRALDAFEAVYKVDPGYENVAALYNQASREHANSLGSTSYYLSDTWHTQWHAEASYAAAVTSVLGVSGSYETDSVHVDRNNWPYGYDHSSYQVHDVSVGMPINLSILGLTFVPRVGGYLEGNAVALRTRDLEGKLPAVDQNNNPVFNQFDQFGSYRVEPYAKADLGLGLGKIAFLTSAVGWGRYMETFDPMLTPIYDSSAELNVSVPFSFINVYPFTNTTLRAYGKIDYLTFSLVPFLDHQNTIYTALGELTVHVLKGGSPYSLLTLIGTVEYQDMDTVNKDAAGALLYMYYAPVAELSAGGSLMGSTWIGMGGGSVLGLRARAYLGNYQQNIRDLPELVHTHYLKLEGEAGAELTVGETVWTLTGLYNNVWNLDALRWNDYWSFYLRLGCTVKLPRLLAP